MKYLNFNASAARTWLLQMGTAAARNDLTIQYCMSHCRHIMQSVEIPAVTNARASGDYHAGGKYDNAIKRRVTPVKRRILVTPVTCALSLHRRSMAAPWHLGNLRLGRCHRTHEG